MHFFGYPYQFFDRDFLLLEISLHHVNDFVEIFERFFGQIIRNSFSELLQHKNPSYILTVAFIPISVNVKRKKRDLELIESHALTKNLYK